MVLWPRQALWPLTLKYLGGKALLTREGGCLSVLQKSMVLTSGLSNCRQATGSQSGGFTVGMHTTKWVHPSHASFLLKHFSWPTTPKYFGGPAGFAWAPYAKSATRPIARRDVYPAMSRSRLSSLSTLRPKRRLAL